MRKITPLYLFFLLLCFVTLQSSQIDIELKHKLSDFNLLGKVKSVRDKIIRGKSQDERNAGLFQQQRFSPEGEETFESPLGRGFYPESGINLQFNNKGDTLTYKFKTLTQGIINYYVFDAKGRIISEIDSNYVIDTAIETPGGRRVTSRRGMNYLYKYVYRRDTILKYQYRRDTLLYYSISICKGAGDVINRKVYLANGVLESSTDNTYDKHHNLVKVADSNYYFQSFGFHKMKYNDKGDMVEDISDYHIKYKQKDNHTVEKREYQYEYDATGNWIKKICILNDAPYETTTRQIEYYK